MIRSRKLSVVVLATTLFMTNTIPGALAQDSGENEPDPIMQIAKPVSKPAVKRAASTAASARRTGSSVLGKADMKEMKPMPINQVLKYAEIPQTTENEGKVKRLDEQADAFFKSARYNDALLRWQEAYGLSLEMKYSAGQGRALTGMCKVYLTQGKWVKAKALGENAVEVLSGINDEKNLGRARIQLAQAYFGLENPLWAIKQLELAMKHLVDQPDTDPAEAAELMRLSGGLLLRFGKVVDGIRFFQESARYLEEAKDLPNSLMMRTKLSNLMTEAGFYLAAREEAEKAVAIAKKANNDRAMVSALAALGNSQYVLGEYIEASQTYAKAYGLAGKMDDITLNKEARSNLLMGYSFALIAIGENDRAEKYIQAILPYFEKESKYYAQTECLNAMGMIVANKGDAYKSLPYFERALDSQNMIKPVQPRIQYMLYQNIAYAEYASGKYREAATHLKAILPIYQRDQKVKTSHPLVILRTLTSLAEVSLRMSDPVKAREYADQALDLGTKFGDDSSLWRAYTVIAQLELANRENEKAKAALENALSHFRSPQAGYFPAVEQFHFISSRRSLGQQLIALVASQGMTEKALLAAEQLKEEQIINTWIRKGVAVRAEDRDVYTDLLNQRAHLHAAEASTTPDKLTKEWSSWLSRFSELGAKNRTLARMVAPYPTTVEDIISGVRKKKVTVIEYLVGEKSSVAFTIDPIGRISATVLPVGEDRLVSSIAPLITNAGLPTPESQSAEKAVLQTLYKQLLPPSVMNFVPSTPDKQIVIIPDSVLFNLPFAALIDETGKYFVENHLLSLSTSMGAILDGAMPTGGGLSVLVADNGTPDERTESRTILNSVDPSPCSTLSAQSANLEELQKVSQDKQILHVSSAIPMTDENPARTKLPFAPDEATKASTADGLFQLSIPNDLVVLSGTSITGSGQTGKAVQVFGRGLRYAGARNVMMSLWNEPSDTRTAEIGNFYKNKKRGMTSAQSLRQAQLLALSADRNPKAWAAFQLLGAGM